MKTTCAYCWWFIALVVAGLLPGGCVPLRAGHAVAESPESSSEKRQRVHRCYEVEVISDPPGAHIQVNDDYVGDAPLTIQMKGDRHGRVTQTYRVRADPNIAGDYVQVKVFKYWEYIDSDPVPRRIRFQMNLVPAGKDLNVNIRDERE